MRIAIGGCCHGELDQVYASIMYIQQQKKIKIDLLLICGDFQATRNLIDLSVLACPEKYRSIGTFYKYYSGEKKAPVPTVFIGGNHEASNYLWELFHGGWVCPNIYFLGFAGLIRFGSLRIAGISGIYKKHDYENGYYEQQPFNESHTRSIYHVRKFNVYRLAQIKQKIDIFLSHDWPRGIALYGNVRKLLLAKPFLAGEINTYTLGSYPSEHLLKLLKPRFWFSAHLHVKFAAIYNHGQAPPSQVLNRPSSDTGGVQAQKQSSEDLPSDAEKVVGIKNATNNGASGGAASAKKSPDGVHEVAKLPNEPLGDNTETEGSTNFPSNASNSDCGNAADKSKDEEADSSISGNPKCDSIISESNIDTSTTAVEGCTNSKATPETPQVGDSSKNTDQAPQDKGQRILKKTQEIPNVTRFLALDKCLPGRDFLQVIDIDVDPPDNPGCAENKFYYDKEWLSVVRSTCNLISFTRQRTQMPPDSEIKKILEEETKWVNDNIPASALQIPENFVMTSPTYSPDCHDNKNFSKIRQTYINPQTQYFCDLLQIKNFINPDGVIVTWDGEIQKPNEKGTNLAEVQDPTREVQVNPASDAA